VMMFMVVICYIYVVMGVQFFGWNKFHYGDGPDNFNTLSEGFWLTLDYGLRGAPMFYTSGDSSEAVAMADHSYGMLFFDISYNMIIILIMVAIITGIIIDTFAEMRVERNNNAHQLRNICFVCSLPREKFERHNLKFDEHLKEHSVWNYLYYMKYLDQREDSDRTGLENEIKKKCDNQYIDWLPIERTISIQEAEALVEERVEESSDGHESLEHFKSINSDIDILLQRIASLEQNVASIANRVEQDKTSSVFDSEFKNELIKEMDKAIQKASITAANTAIQSVQRHLVEHENNKTEN